MKRTTSDVHRFLAPRAKLRGTFVYPGMRACLVLLVALSLGACAPNGPRPEAPRSETPAVARQPVPEPPPPSPSYEALDGRFHHYAVIKIEGFEDHFLATFHDKEGAFCDLSASDASGIRLRGCGFPSWVMNDDEVPEDRQRLLPALRFAVLAQHPGATHIRLRHEGAYRAVYLEEAVPCDGKHGYAYHRVELRYDATLSTLQEMRFLSGTGCASLRYYWASPDPKWLPFTSSRPLLSPESLHSPLSPDLSAALQTMLAGVE